MIAMAVSSFPPEPSYIRKWENSTVMLLVKKQSYS